MIKLLKGLLTSKKFIAAIGGIIVAIAAKKGLDLNQETINGILGVVIAYVVGQGIADNGKAAAEIKVEAEK